MAKAKAKSRPQRWQDAVERAGAALEDLQGLQEEYAEWRDNLPENLADSAISEKLGEVCDTDIDNLISEVEELGNLDLPRGFGRD